ncbi:MFS transporter [Lysinibacillus sp. NPDC096212]|uniref:MFS transporter n=1 Tax=Lysinibacillus sp. NPDC096212 TaxID=3364135 RepID=UPI0037FD2CF0
MKNNLPQVDERKLMRKVSIRILPFLILCYILAYLDRANIGYAALEMNADLGLTSQVFGLATGIFFIGYFVFEIPSNILMEKFGARIWIARILITWGIISGCTAFAHNEVQLYIIRFLLGVAEAGFFPGIILYLTYWFRGKEQASAIAIFSMAIPVSYIIGAPLSTLIMDNFNFLGFEGWRWMFILEAFPAILCGFIAFKLLTDKPVDAKWLNDDEKLWLTKTIENEKTVKQSKAVKQDGHFAAFKNGRVWYLSIIYFVYLTGSLGVGYWMPQIIKGFSDDLSNTQVGFIAMVPYIVATIVMILWSRNSDRTKERKFHSAFPLFVAAITLAGAGAFNAHPVLSMILITFALTGMYSFKGPFWTYPQLLLAPSLLAVSIAMINSFGNLGGFVGPYMMGYLKDTFNTSTVGLYFLSTLLLISSIMIFFLKDVEKKEDIKKVKETEKANKENVKEDSANIFI